MDTVFKGSTISFYLQLNGGCLQFKAMKGCGGNIALILTPLGMRAPCGVVVWWCLCCFLMSSRAQTVECVRLTSHWRDVCFRLNSGEIADRGRLSNSRAAGPE